MCLGKINMQLPICFCLNCYHVCPSAQPACKTPTHNTTLWCIHDYQILCSIYVHVLSHTFPLFFLIGETFSVLGFAADDGGLGTGSVIGLFV